MAELFIVGAQRSGTTYLYNVLDSHPHILMAKPVRPEPKFFLKRNEWEKGREYYESLYYSGRLNEHEYIGEKSTSYIEYKKVAGRIKGYYPDARILFILRNPVERAYSNYRFSVDNGIEDLSFSDALLVEKERLLAAQYNSSVNPFAYVQRGHYIEYIQSYAEVFDKSRINILIHEEFVSNMQAIAALYSWLGVDEGHVPDNYDIKFNESDSVNHNEVAMSKLKSELEMLFVDSNRRLSEYMGRDTPVWEAGDE